MPWWTSGYDPEALDDNGRPLTFAFRVVLGEGWLPSHPVEVTYHAICPICGCVEEHCEGLAEGDELPANMRAICSTSLPRQEFYPYSIRLIAARLVNRIPAEPKRLKRFTEKQIAASAAASTSTAPPPRKATRLPHAALDDRLRRSKSSTIQTALALGYSDTAPPPVPKRDPSILGTIAADIPKRTSPTPATHTTTTRARTRTQPHQTARKPGTYSTDPTQPPSA